MKAQIVMEKLAGLPLGGLRAFDVTGSTNDEALAWCSAGAPDGALVIADEQTQGRGRLDRRWVTRPGGALAFSLVMLPTEAEKERLVWFSTLGALAICEALENRLGLRPSIKWPNDVLLAGRKTAGILVEAAWLGEQLQGVVVGIGVNVSPSSVPPDDQVLFPATSVEDAARRPVDRLDLLRAILEVLFDWRARLTTPAFLKAWDARLAFKNDWVSLSTDAQMNDHDAPLAGQVMGLDSTGRLLLRLPSGEVRPVDVGDVHLRPAR